MSTLSIAAQFPYSRVKVSGQSVAPERDAALIDTESDLRFARSLERRREGILNHCDYPIHNSRLGLGARRH